MHVGAVNHAAQYGFAFCASYAGWEKPRRLAFTSLRRDAQLRRAGLSQTPSSVFVLKGTAFPQPKKSGGKEVGEGKGDFQVKQKFHQQKLKLLDHQNKVYS
jgi:hypothetical protein